MEQNTNLYFRMKENRHFPDNPEVSGVRQVSIRKIQKFDDLFDGKCF